MAIAKKVKGGSLNDADRLVSKQIIPICKNQIKFNQHVDTKFSNTTTFKEIINYIYASYPLKQFGYEG
jgi:hypothetical protein